MPVLEAITVDHQPSPETAGFSRTSTVHAPPDEIAFEHFWSSQLLRTGALLIILFQLALLSFDYYFRPGLERFPPVALHIFAILCGGLAFGGTLLRNRWLHAQWRLVAFAICSLVVIAMTAIEGLTGQIVPFYSGMLLFVVGTGLLLPWGSAWQAAFAGVVIAAFATSSLRMSSDPLIGYGWLGILAAASLAQCSTVLIDAFRKSISARIKMLRKSLVHLHDEIAQRERTEKKLRESETTLRRTFDAAVDAIVITRLSDGAQLGANLAFEKLGLTHASPHGAHLGSWTAPEIRAEYRRRIASEGIVRNMEVDLRNSDGRVIPTLFSGASVELNGEACIVTIMRDITELRETQHQLIEAREAALAASRAKSEFLSSMSHEIRTPMNAILGMAELLAETPLEGQQKQYLAVMEDNGNALLGLIDDILDLARVESGQLSLEQAPFNVAELTERVADTLAIRTRKTQVELVVRVASDLPVTLIGDPLRLNQVLTNLVGNALKFTEHGEVVVAIERDTQSRDPGALLFSISDTGIGIPPEKLTSIFSPFAQADSSTTRKYGGSGLGLAIVQRLVQLMGGRVWIESAVGKGSTFHFTARFGVPPGATDAAARIDLGAVRVLIMDRNATCRASARDIFEAHGATVIEAASADEAAEAVARAQRAAQPFELVFADCSRLDAGGFELARRIGTRAGGAAGLTVATVSSYDLSKAFVGMREAGLEHYVVKPLKRADLLAAAADFARRTPPAVEPATGSALATAAAAIDQSAAPSSDQLPASPARAALPAAAPAEAAARPCRILLADDSIDNRLLIRAYLGKTGYGLDEAENGQVAVDKLVGGRYDLVLMDIQMPVMDGFSAVRRIRQWECEHGARRTPIIALTASAFDETIRKAVEAGCDSHLGKPLKRSTLLRVIRETALGDRPNQAAADAA